MGTVPDGLQTSPPPLANVEYNLFNIYLCFAACFDGQSVFSIDIGIQGKHVLNFYIQGVNIVTILYTH